MPPRATPFTPSPYVRGGNLGELIRQRGRSASEAEYRRGEIAARMYSDLGQQISGAIQGYQKEQREAPIRAQEAKARDLNIQQAEGALAAQQRDTRATQTQNALMPLALKTGDDGIATFDEDLLTREFTTAGIADRLPSVLKSLGDFRTSAAQFKKLQGDLQAAQVDTIANLAFGALEAGGTMAAAQRAIELLDANGIVSKDEATNALEGVTDDASMQARLMEIAKSSPSVRQEMEGRRQRQATEALTRQTATAAAADREEDNRRLDTTAAEAARHNRAMEANAARSGGAANEPLEQIVGPDGKVVLVRRSDAVGKTPGAGTEKSSSGVQKRVLNFFNRAQQADKDLEVLEPEIETLGLAGQARMATMPNFAQSQLGQSYIAAQRAFTEARLRKDSGAAIPEHEYSNDQKTYFVQPGDSKTTIQDKNRARATLLASLAFESGQALGEYVGDADEAQAIVDSYKARAARPADGGRPDLSGLKPGVGRKFKEGPYAGQTWAVDASGTPYQVP